MELWVLFLHFMMQISLSSSHPRIHGFDYLINETIKSCFKEVRDEEFKYLRVRFTSEGSEIYRLIGAIPTLSYGPWSVAGLGLRDEVRTWQSLPEGDSLAGSACCYSWRKSPGMRVLTWFDPASKNGFWTSSLALCPHSKMDTADGHLSKSQILHEIYFKVHKVLPWLKSFWAES